MDERAFWLEIRRAAMIVIRAIEARYNIGSKTQEKATPDRH